MFPPGCFGILRATADLFLKNEDGATKTKSTRGKPKPNFDGSLSCEEAFFALDNF